MLITVVYNLKVIQTDDRLHYSYTNGSGTESMYMGGADNVLYTLVQFTPYQNGTTIWLKIDASGNGGDSQP